MKELKTIGICVLPFMVTAIMMFPFSAIIGGGLDPFMWERTDRVFYFICSGAFGMALLARLLHGANND